MTGHLNHLAALERVADMHRAAERSRLVAEARSKPERAPRSRTVVFGRSWLGVRRRLKLA